MENMKTLKFERDDNEVVIRLGAGTRPVDANNPEHASTAVELTLPTSFSAEAWAVWNYLDGAAFIYDYDGRLVVTDEALDLTYCGDGSHENPIGGPRWIVDSWDELEEILVATYCDLVENAVIEPVEKILSEEMYDEPIKGGSITGNFVEVIGERVVNRCGKILEQYLYNIEGYTPKNGLPFVALKSNIYLFG